MEFIEKINLKMYDKTTYNGIGFYIIFVQSKKNMLKVIQYLDIYYL